MNKQTTAPTHALAVWTLVIASACAQRAGVTSATPQAAPQAAMSAQAPESLAQPVRAGDKLGELIQQAYAHGKTTTGGKNADYIPALAEVDSNLFGIALVTVQGDLYEVGDTRSEFSIQSVSKIFTLSRAIELLGPQAVSQSIGVNATGLPFNSVLAVELNQKTHPAMNPLVNAGAMSTVGLLPETNPKTKWDGLMATYSAFAGRTLGINQPVYKSESETNTHNQGIAVLLKSYDVIKADVPETVDLYTRQCSVNVSAKDLAVMGATLANGGKNPITGDQVVKSDVVPHVLAVMSTAGLYETTGEWLYRVGVPAKSGVGGGIVAVVPGKFAIGTFAPPLDEAGNSVRGQAAIAEVVRELDVNLFAAQPSTLPSTAKPAAQANPAVLGEPAP